MLASKYSTDTSPSNNIGKHFGSDQGMQLWFEVTEGFLNPGFMRYVRLWFRY